MPRRMVVASVVAVLLLIVSTAFIWVSTERGDSNRATAGPVAWAGTGSPAQLLGSTSGSLTGVPGGGGNFQLQPVFPISDRAVGVMGVGMASAPAETATIQFFVGRGFGAAMFEGTPPTGGPTAASLTEEDLAPIRDALIEAGVPEEDIETHIMPGGGGEAALFGGAMGRITVTVSNPDQDGISGLVEAATTAASEAGQLTIANTSVQYGVGNCLELEREALANALEDTRTQAQMLVELMDTEIGELVYVSEFDVTGLLGSSPCDPGSNSMFGLLPFDLSSLTPYDPSQPAEVQVRTTVMATYAVGE